MCNLKARHFQAALENSEQALSLDTSCATWKLLSLHEPAVSVGIFYVFPKESIQSQKSPKKQQGSRNTFLYISIVVTVDICRHDLGELVAELLVVRPGEGLLSQGPSP